MGGGVAEGRVGGLIHNSHNYPQMLSHGAPSPSRFFFFVNGKRMQSFFFLFCSCFQSAGRAYCKRGFTSLVGPESFYTLLAF